MRPPSSESDEESSLLAFEDDSVRFNRAALDPIQRYSFATRQSQYKRQAPQFKISETEKSQEEVSLPHFANDSAILSPYQPMWEIKHELKEAPWKDEEAALLTPTQRGNRCQPQSLLVKRTNFASTPICSL